MSIYQQMRLGALPPLGLPGLQGGVMQPMGLPPFPSLMSLQGAPVATQPEMGSSVPEDSFARARRIIRDSMQAAPQEIDPDIAALLQRREDRLAQQEAQAEERANPNAWRDLIRIGTAMMGTQSPQFGQGLAQGLMATVEEQQKRRDELVRQRAAIEQAREGIESRRIEQRGAGRKRAMDELKAVSDLAGTLGQADLREAQTAQAQAEADLKRMKADPRFTNLEIAEAQAKVDAVKALTTQRLTAAGLNRANAAVAGQRRGGGGERGMTPGQRLELGQKVNEAASVFNAAARAYEAERKAKNGDLDKMDQTIVENYIKARADFNSATELEKQITGRSTFNRRPFTGGLGVAGGATTAAPSSSGVIDFGSLAR